MKPEARVELIGATEQQKALLVGRLSSVSVEQVAHGCSKVDLVLDNQSFDGQGKATSVFTDFATLDFGKRFRVDIRYVGGASWPAEVSQEPGHRLGRFAGDTTWFPLILARITNMSFSFPGSGAAKLTVQGEDLLSLFKVNPAADKVWRDKHEFEIVSTLLSDIGSPMTMGSSGPESTFGQPVKRVRQQKASTQLQFINRLAKRLDYEVFVDFDNYGSHGSADTGPTKVGFHFERCRSLRASSEDLVDLVWGRHVLSFSPSFEFWKQYTGAVASGQDPRTRRRFDDAAADVRIVDQDLLGGEQAGDFDQDVQSAVAVRAAFAERESTAAENIKHVQATGLGKPRATRKAEAHLLNAARRFLTAQLEVVGLPWLRPGFHVVLHGFDQVFNGTWYVEKAGHSFDDSGYRTALSIRRPGYSTPVQAT